EDPGAEVVAAVERVDEIGGAAEGHGDRVDREVPAAEVIGERPLAHLRERTGLRVGLGSRAGDVDLDPVDDSGRGPEALVRDGIRVEPPRDRDRVALDDHVEVADPLRLDAEQEVANDAADREGRRALRRLLDAVDSGQRGEALPHLPGGPFQPRVVVPAHLERFRSMLRFSEMARLLKIWSSW